MVSFFWYEDSEDVDNINLAILPMFFDSSRDEHIPAKRLHTLSSIILDLLEFSFKYLVVGGRLVYWLPVYKPRYVVKLYFCNDVYLTSNGIHYQKNIAVRFYKSKKMLKTSHVYLLSHLAKAKKMKKNSKFEKLTFLILLPMSSVF